jgi:hypothetical protein
LFYLKFCLASLLTESSLTPPSPHTPHSPHFRHMTPISHSHPHCGDSAVCWEMLGACQRPRATPDVPLMAAVGGTIAGPSATPAIPSHQVLLACHALPPAGAPSPHTAGAFTLALHPGWAADPANDRICHDACWSGVSVASSRWMVALGYRGRIRPASGSCRETRPYATT